MRDSWWFMGAWLTLAVVWLAGALGTKKTAKSEPAERRAGHMITVLIAAWLLFTNDVPDLLRPRLVPDSRTFFALGALLTWAGIGFAIWARLTLGRNWSGLVEVKENHSLVVRGPYRLVRHPIYSGVLLAMLGTAIGGGELRGFVAVPFAFAAWWTKSRHEEQFMVQQFGEQYTDYQTRVKAIIPLVL